MNCKLLRFFTMVAVSTITFTLAISASADLQINRADANISRQIVDVVPKSPNGIYIIQMADDPVVTYDGSIKGFMATKPDKGKKIDPESKHVINYARYLDGKHSRALSRVGGREKIYDYHYSFNGFSAKLSNKQANRLQSVDGVEAVRPDKRYQLDTATTPAFIGLRDEDGLWDMGELGEDVFSEAGPIIEDRGLEAEAEGHRG